jgi:hypothetical protein
VGQIYGTLERVTSAGLVFRSGQTDDGLPLYVLSPSGHEAATAWLRGEDVVSATDWTELLDHIFIARSLDSSFLESVVGVYEAVLVRDPAVSSSVIPGTNAMVTAAHTRFANAALGLLGDVRREMSGMADSRTQDGERPNQAPGYLTQRPKRGRPASN